MACHLGCLVILFIFGLLPGAFTQNTTDPEPHSFPADVSLYSKDLFLSLYFNSCPQYNITQMRTEMATGLKIDVSRVVPWNQFCAPQKKRQTAINYLYVSVMQASLTGIDIDRTYMLMDSLNGGALSNYSLIYTDARNVKDAKFLPAWLLFLIVFSAGVLILAGTILLLVLLENRRKIRQQKTRRYEPLDTNA